jgi:hypothetical protein
MPPRMRSARSGDNASTSCPAQGDHLPPTSRTITRESRVSHAPVVGQFESFTLEAKSLRSPTILYQTVTRLPGRMARGSSS